MSRHEGVSCDSCLKGNFRGRRYKCLVCYDYDLCAACYEAGATTTRHTTDHAVQCIITRSDFDVFYGGEALTPEQPQSFTCPYCGKMGYTDATLHDHVTAEHADTSVEIVCPICASLPGGDPNHMTDDFAGHLAVDHRTPRDFDEPPGLRHVRRIPHPNRGGGSRTRRGNMHFGSASSTLTGLSPSGRDNMDPIADVREWMPELLSQLSSVRNRAAAQSVSSQLQQLEMQLQSTRFLSLSGRQQLERIPRRQPEAGKVTGSAVNNANTIVANSEASALAASHPPNHPESQFLLAKLPEEGPAGSSSSNGGEVERLEKNMFVQELLLSTLTERLQQSTHSDDPFLLLDSLRSPEPESQRKSTSSADKSVGGSGSQGARGSTGGATGTGSSSASMGREGAGGGGKNVASEGHCKNKNANNAATVVSGKACSAVNNIPSNNGRPVPGLSTSSPGASISVEGRSSVTGAGTSSSGVGSPPSARSLLSSRPPLLPPRQQPSSSTQPQPHGSTVNLNEHAMGLSSRQAAASMSARDASHLKRSMLKHLPANRGARDMDPPPH